MTLAMVRPSSNTSRTIFFEFRLITFVRVCHFNHLHFHFDYIIYSNVSVTTLLYHLIVAEKYQTGFDEPLLHTMFVDKKLSGVKAVQTLSRLNRTTRGKVDTFVLDFVNSAEDIKASFEPFYEETVLLEETDPNVVYDMKNTLDDFRVYQKSEVDKFADIFYQSENQSAGDLGKLQGQLRPAADRYEQNDQFFRKLFDDPDMMKQVIETVGSVLYERLKKKYIFDPKSGVIEEATPETYVEDTYLTKK